MDERGYSRGEGFGVLLAMYRKRAGLTQWQLASMLGVSRSTISRWEIKCEVPPGDPELVEAIARYVGVEPQQLAPDLRKPAPDLPIGKLLAANWSYLDAEAKRNVEGVIRMAVDAGRTKRKLKPLPRARK